MNVGGQSTSEGARTPTDGDDAAVEPKDGFSPPHPTEPACLAFSLANVPPVISRRKWVTARHGLEDSLLPGQPLIMLTENKRRPFARSRIEMVTGMTVAEFYAFEFNGHKTYRTLDECVDALQGYYPGSTLTERSRLDVIGWDPEQLKVHPEFQSRTAPAETWAAGDNLRGGPDA